MTARYGSRKAWCGPRIFEAGRSIDAAALRAAMEEAFGASDTSGSWVWKDAYEAAEVAQIQMLSRYGALMQRQAASPQAFLTMIERLAGLAPSHTRRTEDSVRLQQFSTRLAADERLSPLVMTEGAKVPPVRSDPVWIRGAMGQRVGAECSSPGQQCAPNQKIPLPLRVTASVHSSREQFSGPGHILRCAPILMDAARSPPLLVSPHPNRVRSIRGTKQCPIRQTSKRKPA
uniref:RC105 n=1 Tax=Ruegeria sp. PR1b TaxID=185588 RepID=Q8KW85_9RHOB|nr:RC105 [Ruegeria sp. PR1b]